MTKALAAAAAALAAFPLFLILLVTASTGTPAQAAPAATGLAGAPTALAMSGIPADYLAWYMAAAKTCPGLPWSVLAGIGEVESGHGRSALPGVRSGSNGAGAEGPMQFEPATFAQFAVNADPGQPLSPYDPADAIYTAAAMLCANGARGGTPAGIEQAVFAYNHAQWYVSEVMAWAARYATQGGSHDAAAPACDILVVHAHHMPTTPKCTYPTSVLSSLRTATAASLLRQWPLLLNSRLMLSWYPSRFEKSP